MNMAWVSNLLFYLSSFLVFASTIALIISKNVIHNCIFLLGTLLGVAGLYFSLGADFVGAIQIIVYVGGMVILMLFAVMLTGGQEFKESNNPSYDRLGMKMTELMGNKRTYIIGLISAVVFLLSTSCFISRTFYLQSAQDLLKMPDLISTVNGLGVMLMTDHVLAFEMVSILLLGALVGAAIIARPSKGELE